MLKLSSTAKTIICGDMGIQKNISFGNNCRNIAFHPSFPIWENKKAYSFVDKVPNVCLARFLYLPLSFCPRLYDRELREWKISSKSIWISAVQSNFIDRASDRPSNSGSVLKPGRVPHSITLVENGEFPASFSYVHYLLHLTNV